MFVEGLADAFDVTRLADVTDREKFFAETAPRLRGIACSWTNERVEGEFMRRLPRLEIVSTFGVGYDHIDIAWAAKHPLNELVDYVPPPPRPQQVPQ